MSCAEGGLANIDGMYYIFHELMHKMVESWTEPFAYLVTKWKLYYVITSHMSTQMEVHRWQKNC